MYIPKTPSPILGPLPGRLKLLAKQTVNPRAGVGWGGVGGRRGMWIGAGSSQVGDYLIPLRGFALPFLSHKHYKRAALTGCPQGPARDCVLASVCLEMSDRLKKHTGRANDR